MWIHKLLLFQKKIADNRVANFADYRVNENHRKLNSLRKIFYTQNNWNNLNYFRSQLINFHQKILKKHNIIQMFIIFRKYYNLNIHIMIFEINKI